MIKRFWFGYKVCEGCDCLVYEEIAICPNCYAYRFDDSKERVYEATDVMLSNDTVVRAISGLPLYTENDEEGYSDSSFPTEK